MHVHQRGYIHLDVWSENILVDSAGNGVLCDFGCAAMIGSEVQSQLNMPYMSPGTWNWLKPMPADDCWALCLVLSEMITGKLLMQRLGGDTSCPIHTNPLAFANLKKDTRQCSARLGMLCERVLGDGRIDMKEIYETLGGSITGTATATTSWDPPGIQTLQPSPIADVSNSYTSMSALCVPDQRVQYLARCDGRWYPGKFAGRTPEQNGWLVQLDCGPIKTVDDADVAVRLKV
jgi:serine/threonine protein kinase